MRRQACWWRESSGCYFCFSKVFNAASRGILTDKVKVQSKVDSEVDWKLLKCWAERVVISSTKPSWISRGIPPSMCIAVPPRRAQNYGTVVTPLELQLTCAARLPCSRGSSTGHVEQLEAVLHLELLTGGRRHNFSPIPPLWQSWRLFSCEGCDCMDPCFRQTRPVHSAGCFPKCPFLGIRLISNWFFLKPQIKISPSLFSP